MRFFVEPVLRRCMTKGLVQGEGFAIDVSIIRADANRARSVPASQVAQWRQGTQCSRAVREYLDALDATNPVSDDAPEEVHDTEFASRNISPTDPAAHWTAAPGGPGFYAYSTNYLTDLSEGIILDVEATPAHRTPEVDSTRTMIDRVEERFDVRPRRGDAASMWQATGRRHRFRQEIEHRAHHSAVVTTLRIGGVKPVIPAHVFAQHWHQRSALQVRLRQRFRHVGYTRPAQGQFDECKRIVGLHAAVYCDLILSAFGLEG